MKPSNVRSVIVPSLLVALGWGLCLSSPALGQSQTPSEEAAEPAKKKAEPPKAEKAETKEMSAKEKRAVLLDPKSPEMTKRAPDVFKVKFETSKGDIVLEVKRELSPLGVDRFYNLVRFGFYDEARFFRVMSGFMAQFGINADPNISKKWIDAGIKDEPVKASNTAGMMSFAKRSAPNSRTTQLFINFGNNSGLDRQGFSPFAQVVEGMDVVNSINAAHGQTPRQDRIQNEGNAYLKKAFPDLDYIKKATVLVE